MNKKPQTDITRPLDEIVIRWCNLCGTWYVACPRCGNNTCNGGSGEYNGEKCTLCPKVYELDDKLNNGGLSPLIDELLGKG